MELFVRNRYKYKQRIIETAMTRKRVGDEESESRREGASSHLWQRITKTVKMVNGREGLSSCVLYFMRYVVCY